MRLESRAGLLPASLLKAGVAWGAAIEEEGRERGRGRCGWNRLSCLYGIHLISAEEEKDDRIG